MDATRSFAYTTPGNVKDSVKYIWMSIVEPDPEKVNLSNMNRLGQRII